MLEFFSHALEAKAAYVEQLPTWVQWWMNIMTVVFGAGFLFAPKHAEARWLLVAVIGSVFAALVWGGFFGFGKLWSLFHIVFYTPCLIYLVKRRKRLVGSRYFLAWLALAATIMTVSLAFDFVDFVGYVFGAKA